MTNKEQRILNDEGEKLEKFLNGKKVVRIMRHREKEILLEFEDGTRLFID